MLSGHIALSRASGRGLAVAFMLAFTLQAALLLVQLLSPGLLPTGLRAATGSSLPVLLYLFFSRSRADVAAWRWRDAAHALPVALLIALVATPGSGWLIDAALLLIELGYALAILSSDRRDAEQPVRRRARHAAAGFLLAMAASDLWIGWELSRGVVLGWGASFTVTACLLVAGVAALFVAAWRDPEWLVRLHDRVRDSAPETPTNSEPNDIADADRQLCSRLDELFRSRRSFAEFGIGLDDVAKQLKVPPRQLSTAVNRVQGRGFRTLLNDYRVEDAARQLADPSLAGKPITEVMFDAGFQTKSSFNKEFMARRAVSPSQFRKDRCSPRPLSAAAAAAAES